MYSIKLNQQSFGGKNLVHTTFDFSAADRELEFDFSVADQALEF